MRRKEIGMFVVSISILQSPSGAAAGETVQEQNDLTARVVVPASPIVSDKSEGTTVTVIYNRRAAQVPFGGLFHLVGIDHVWISTPDGATAGMGDARGVPQSELPLVPMKVVDHTGQVANATHKFTGVDRAAIATYMKPGQRLGPWIPLLNDCIGWALNAIYNSRPHNIYLRIGPVGRVTQVLLHRNVVVYADGSIHSPGE